MMSLVADGMSKRESEATDGFMSGEVTSGVGKEESLLEMINKPKGVAIDQQEKIEERKKNFFQPPSIDDSKRKRDDILERTLRKPQREELVKKRRGYKMNDLSQDIFEEYSNMYANLTFKIEDLPLLVNEINSQEESKVYHATVGFRKLLANEGASPIQEIIDANIVPKLIELIGSDKPYLQFEAAWCLTNIATGTAEQTQCLTEKGAVPKFIDLLSSEKDNIKDQAIWALGNIAGENTTYRDLVIDSGVLPPLLKILKSPNKFTIIKNGVWCLSNVCRSRPPPKFSKVKDAIKVICQLTKENEDKEILTDCCWTLSYLSDGGEKRIPYLMECDILPRLVNLLEHPCMSIAIPALRTLGNVITGDDNQTQSVLDVGMLGPLGKLMDNPKSAVRKEACWAASNITAGNSTQVQGIIDSGIMNKLIKAAQTDLFEIKREAIWAISNSTSGAEPHQIKYMVENGAIHSLCNLLVLPDPRTLAITLEGLENLLKKGRDFFSQDGMNWIAVTIDSCGGLARLETLQSHPNIHIYSRTVKIIEEYFGVEDSEMLQVEENPQFNIFNF